MGVAGHFTAHPCHAQSAAGDGRLPPEKPSSSDQKPGFLQGQSGSRGFGPVGLRGNRCMIGETPGFSNRVTGVGRLAGCYGCARSRLRVELPKRGFQPVSVVGGLEPVVRGDDSPLAANELTVHDGKLTV